MTSCKTADEKERTDKIIRPILRGRDIKRNRYDWAGLYLICTFPAAHIDIEDYSAIKKYFESGEWSSEIPNGYGKLKLEQTGQKHKIGEYEFTSRKKTSNEWFETQDQIAYMDDFDRQKIMYSEIVREPQFLLDDGNFVPEATTFIMCGEHLRYLISYLNSPIVGWIFKKFYAGGGLGDSGYRYKKQFLINLPIPLTNTDISVDDDFIIKTYGFNEEEICFISDSLKSKAV